MSHTTFFHSVKTEIKNNLTLSLPLTSSQLIYSSSGFIGTAMVARLGEDALAASVLVSTIWMTLSVLFFGILNSISILVSHQFGARNDENISKIMGQAFLLGICIATGIVALLSLMPWFLHLTPQPASVLALAKTYMHSVLWMMPGLVMLVVYEQLLAGINRAKLVLRISLIVVPIEIPLIYAFIFGKFGLPECGIAGIGYGFAVTYTLTALGLILYFYKVKSVQHYEVFKHLGTIDVTWLKELLRVGLPMGFMHVIEVSTFAIVTFWMAQFGTSELAAHQIVMQYLGFTVNIIFAMSQAVTIRVGHEVGRQNESGIHYAIYVGMALNFILMALIALAFHFFPRVFLSLDIDINNAANTLLVTQAAALLSMGGLLMIFDNFRIIGFGALRGLKDTRFPMYASFVSFWMIGLTAAFLLAFHFQLRGPGIWWGLCIGIASGAVIILIRIQCLLRKLDLEKLLKI